MIYGAVLDQGQKWYTDLGVVFDAVGQIQKEYHWLITDWECNQEVRQLKGNYCWLTGAQLTSLFLDYPQLQWIWAVVSGFEKTIPKEQILTYPLPQADGLVDLYSAPVFIQHPLACIEMVCMDSSLVLLKSKFPQIVDNFKKFFPLSKELHQYVKSSDDRI